MTSTLDLRVHHRRVGEAHVLFVPEGVLAAKGAGLVVTAKDEIDAVGLFEVALATASRRGRLPDGTRWHFADVQLHGRLGPVISILGEAVALRDGPAAYEAAIHWFRSQPLPSFGGQTDESLVRAGQTDAVHSYLKDLANRGFT
ncbi:hypothetical protein [Muricoccus aerilatus]|uniref:hypothetical protein n=1 Tax=Muricoccus aerilatus TaxID=452982 RepID=UPI000693BFB6|nr:hypothetical protein [Roseomonas aerilata]